MTESTPPVEVRVPSGWLGMITALLFLLLANQVGWELWDRRHELWPEPGQDESPNTLSTFIPRISHHTGASTAVVEHRVRSLHRELNNSGEKVDFDEVVISIYTSSLMREDLEEAIEWAREKLTTP